MSVSHITSGVGLARILSVTPETIRRWRQDNIIPSIRINRSTIRYDVVEVVQALKDRSDDLQQVELVEQ